MLVHVSLSVRPCVCLSGGSLERMCVSLLVCVCLTVFCLLGYVNALLPAVYRTACLRVCLFACLSVDIALWRSFIR